MSLTGVITRQHKTLAHHAIKSMFTMTSLLTRLKTQMGHYPAAAELHFHYISCTMPPSNDHHPVADARVAYVTRMCTLSPVGGRSLERFAFPRSDAPSGESCHPDGMPCMSSTRRAM
jgi:hypothetical protein